MTKRFNKQPISFLIFSFLWMTTFGTSLNYMEYEIENGGPNLMAPVSGVGKRRLQFFGGIFTTPAATTAAPGTTGGGGGGGATTAAPVTIDKLEDIDTLLTYEELYEILQGNNANPRPSNIGEGWDNSNIVELLQYYEPFTPWYETLWGQLVAAIAGVFFFFFLVMLLYFMFRCANTPTKQKVPWWWHLRPRTPSAPTPQPQQQQQPPPPPPQPQIYFLTVGGGGGGTGAMKPARQNRRDSSNMPDMFPMPPVYTPNDVEDVPEPVQYQAVHSARGEH